MSDDYIKCKKCDTYIAKQDAEKNGGLCTICKCKELTENLNKS
jgi:hypothetical protein